MKYEAVLFDLDGTLLSTGEDLADAVNHTLAAWGYAAQSHQTVIDGTGNGAANLMAYCLPQGRDTPHFQEILEDYRQWYQAHSLIKTAPYAGIPEMLSSLQEQGVKVAILSNKPDGAVKVLCQKFFPGIPAYGEQKGIPIKPDAGMLFHVIEELDAKRDNTAYVGDSEVDIQTCWNARMDFIGVSWGFRGKERLHEKAPCATVVDTAEELLKCLIDKDIKA